MAVDAFTTSIKWAEENGMSACEILLLKKKCKKSFKSVVSSQKLEDNGQIFHSSGIVLYNTLRVSLFPTFD